MVGHLSSGSGLPTPGMQIMLLTRSPSSLRTKSRGIGRGDRMGFNGGPRLKKNQENPNRPFKENNRGHNWGEKKRGQAKKPGGRGPNEKKNQQNQGRDHKKAASMQKKKARHWKRTEKTCSLQKKKQRGLGAKFQKHWGALRG